MLAELKFGDMTSSTVVTAANGRLSEAGTLPARPHTVSGHKDFDCVLVGPVWALAKGYWPKVSWMVFRSSRASRGFWGTALRGGPHRGSVETGCTRNPAPHMYLTALLVFLFFVGGTVLDSTTAAASMPPKAAKQKRVTKVQGPVDTAGTVSGVKCKYSQRFFLP